MNNQKIETKSLTDSEKKLVRSVCFSGKSVRKIPRDSFLWHCVADNWNWDDGIAPLLWIIQQPETDKASALMIYWLAGPRWLYQFKPTDLPNESKDVYKLISIIEKNFKQNFYKSNNFYFDPLKLSEQHKEVQTIIEIPSEMYVKLEGKVIANTSLSGTPNIPFTESTSELNSNQQSKIDKLYAKGLEYLSSVYPSLSKNSAPFDLITFIPSVVSKYVGKREKYKITATEKNILKTMNIVFMEQVRRAYDGKWMYRQINSYGFLFMELFGGEYTYSDQEDYIISLGSRHADVYLYYRMFAIINKSNLEIYAKNAAEKFMKEHPVLEDRKKYIQAFGANFLIPQNGANTKRNRELINWLTS